MVFRVTFCEKTYYETYVEADSEEDLQEMIDNDEIDLLEDADPGDSYIENVVIDPADDDYTE